MCCCCLYMEKPTVPSRRSSLNLSILFIPNFGPASQIKAGGHLISPKCQPSEIRLWSRKEDGNQLKWDRKMKTCNLQRTQNKISDKCGYKWRNLSWKVESSNSKQCM